VLWLLRDRGGLDVTAEMPRLIRTYNEATGVANTDSGGYHQTITLASIRAARSVLHEHGEAVPLRGGKLDAGRFRCYSTGGSFFRAGTCSIASPLGRAGSPVQMVCGSMAPGAKALGAEVAIW
jgi:hypothetical protein